MTHLMIWAILWRILQCQLSFYIFHQFQLTESESRETAGVDSNGAHARVEISLWLSGNVLVVQANVDVSLLLVVVDQLSHEVELILLSNIVTALKTATLLHKWQASAGTTTSSNEDGHSWRVLIHGRIELIEHWCNGSALIVEPLAPRRVWADRNHWIRCLTFAEVGHDDVVVVDAAADVRNRSVLERWVGRCAKDYAFGAHARQS
jgi:hypothetical protein